MDNWDSIIRNKTNQAEPYKPTPKWDKMSAMLDQEMPLAAASNGVNPLWKWAAVFFLFIGISAATIIWWPFSGMENQNPTIDELSIVTPIDSCEEVIETYFPSIESNFTEKTPNQKAVQTPVIINQPTNTNHQKAKKLSPSNLRLANPEMGQQRGQSLASHSPEKDKTSKTKHQELIPFNGNIHQNSPINLNESEVWKSGEFIHPELREPTTGERLGHGVKKYASITRNALLVALGPGAKMKWAKHKWGVEAQLRLNRLPKRDVVYGAGPDAFSYSYNPITPGIAINVFRRFNPRWEAGIRGGVDGIWFPVEATPDIDNDFTEVWGTGLEGSLFAKFYLRKNVEKRFRPYLIGSAGVYQMNIGLGYIENVGNPEENPDSWTSRKRAPDLTNQQMSYTYTPTSYTYLTGSGGMGVNIRLYRRFSVNYQVAIAGNALIKEGPDPNEFGHLGFNHQWQHSMGIKMTF